MHQGWIGLDVGGTGIKAGLVVDGVIHVERKVATDRASDMAICEQLHVLVKDLMAAGNGQIQIGGVGVAVPGVVDSEAGIAVRASNLPWNNTPVCGFLHERTGLPVFLENDTNAGAVGELVFGAGQGVDDFFYMAIGTGVGGGIISEGRLLRGGKLKHAGEVGHIVVDRSGPVCGCGQVGCLEAMAAAPAIGRMGREAATKAGQGSLWDRMQSGQGIEAKDVFEAAAEGDPAASRVVETTGLYLAVGLVAVGRILSPDLVIVGGGVAASGQLILDAMDQGLHTLGAKPMAIKLSGLTQPGVVGAAAVGKNQTELKNMYSPTEA